MNLQILLHIKAESTTFYFSLTVLSSGLTKRPLAQTSPAGGPKGYMSHCFKNH